MAVPAAALAKAAAAALSDEETRKRLGWIVAAILSPLILTLAFFCSLLSGSVDHNNSAVLLCFRGGEIPASTPAEYVAYIEEMRDSFQLLDELISTVNEMTEDGESLDEIRVKAVFYALYFGENAPSRRAHRQFVDCFVTYEERTRTVNGAQVVVGGSEAKDVVNNAKDESFKDDNKMQFAEKYFKDLTTKKTTDDCYTPPEVYAVVLDYVRERWGVEESDVVRPFWPGGDYEAFEYPEGCVVVAGEQTAGRGRRGRQFYSPKDTGVYMSLLLRPKHCAVSRATGFTAMAAVAICEAIEAVSGEDAQIKWVNDVFVRGKKVCGILTEASLGMESGEVDTVVLGAGVNLYPPREGFPEELKPIAGAIFEETVSDAKNRLAGEFLRRMMAIYAAPEESSYVKKYRERSLVIGKTVTLLPEGRSVFIEDIDDACHLLVRDDSGETACLSYGEIQVRM